ncbi:MAG: hypothetical protein ACP5DQ_10790 [Bacteroidales bacterium]
MERTKYILITFLVSFCVSVFGQTNTKIYKAYIHGNMVAWKTHMDSYKANTNEQKMNLVNYQYGYIAYCIDQDKDDEAEKYLAKAETLLAELEKQQYEISMVNAYKSAFIGFKIGLSPYKAPFIGQASLDFAKKSVAQDGRNYFGYVQLGNIAFYTPAIFGGSKEDAMKHYLKALELLDKNHASLNDNWNYLNLLATIINAYYEIGNYEKAKQYCIKTLAIESNFDWVKNVLYPKTLKKTENE